jgi:hypothetical protein
MASEERCMKILKFLIMGKDGNGVLLESKECA